MGCNVAGRLGAHPQDLILRGDGITRRPTPWATFFLHKTWGALTNPATGRTLLLVSRQADVVLRDAGRVGRVLEPGKEVHLAANSTREFTYYLILVDTWEEALPYLALQEYYRTICARGGQIRTAPLLSHKQPELLVSSY